MTQKSNKNPKADDSAMDRIEEEPLEAVLDTAIEEAERGNVEVGELLDTFGHRSFGPVLMIFGIFIMSPVGMVPGIPIVIGLAIILIAGQLVFGFKHPWLPDRLQKLSFERDKIEQTREKGGAWLSRIDALVSRRIEWATGDLASRLAALVCIGLSVLMAPLEFVPFAVLLPGAVITVFGLAITARDGVLMLMAFAATGITAYFAHGWIMSLV